MLLLSCFLASCIEVRTIVVIVHLCALSLSFFLSLDIHVQAYSYQIAMWKSDKSGIANGKRRGKQTNTQYNRTKLTRLCLFTLSHSLEQLFVVDTAIAATTTQTIWAKCNCEITKTLKPHHLKNMLKSITLHFYIFTPVSLISSCCCCFTRRQNTKLTDRNCVFHNFFHPKQLLMDILIVHFFLSTTNLWHPNWLILWNGRN